MTAWFKDRFQLLPLLILVTAGCARNVSKMPSSTYAEPPPPPTSIPRGERLAELEQTLADNEGTLLAVLAAPGGAPGDAAIEGAATEAAEAERNSDVDTRHPNQDAVGEAAPPAASPMERPAPASAPPRVEKARREEPPCVVACRAFDSMNRAARRICVITGEDSASCNDARERVQSARERIVSAGCGCGS
ncbi:MAG: hypothetical protein JW751_06240 [Polyangiaceae bacterium]|nr:hypothetical protein [Polyangiaceae bacterium]